MGWRGTVRSVTAAMRAAEKEAERRRKQALKEQKINEAADAVADWQQYIDELVSIHADLVDPIDWHRVANQAKPQEPHLQRTHQEAARQALDEFKPSFVDIFRGGSEKLRGKLEDELARACQLDEAEYEEAKARYADELAEWESDTRLARRLIQGEQSAIEEVLNEFHSFSDEELIGLSINFSFCEGFVHAQPQVHSEDIVPNVRRKQLASGKLSETRMPVGQFNELYQDYVASVALKVAGDVFRIIPIDEVYVTCMAQMLNSQTGYQELTPIVSVQFVRETIEGLNIARVDPSDSLSNFNHVMNFKKTQGFSPITPLMPID